MYAAAPTVNPHIPSFIAMWGARCKNRRTRVGRRVDFPRYAADVSRMTRAQLVSSVMMGLAIVASATAAAVHRPGGGHDMFSRALISDNRYLRTPVIGMVADEVERRYGRPEWRSDSSITYSCVGSCIAVEDPVEFIFADGRVRRVRLSYYVD